MTNRWQHPLQWALEQIDELNRKVNSGVVTQEDERIDALMVRVHALEQEVERLEREKAGKRGRKKQN